MLKNDAKIIAWLKKQTAPTGTREITKGTRLSYQSVLRSVTRLSELGALGTLPGPGQSKLYYLPRVVEIEQEEMVPDLGKTRPVDLYGALKVFQKHKLPRFMETGTYKAYARAVAGLFSHAVEVGYGASPDRSELMSYRQGLIQYKEELANHLRGIQAILDTKELWDERRNPEFLMAMHGFDLAEISDKVNQAREANK